MDRWPKYFIFGGLAAREIEKEIRNKINLIARYMPSILAEDMSVWDDIIRVSVSRGIIRMQDGETRADFAERLRACAKSSWRKKEYWSVRLYYDTLGRVTSGLSVVERLRYIWASFSTFDIEFLK